MARAASSETAESASNPTASDSNSTLRSGPATSAAARKRRPQGSHVAEGAGQLDRLVGQSLRLIRLFQLEVNTGRLMPPGSHGGIADPVAFGLLPGRQELIKASASLALRDSQASQRFGHQKAQTGIRGVGLAQRAFELSGFTDQAALEQDTEQAQLGQEDWLILLFARHLQCPPAGFLSGGQVTLPEQRETAQGSKRREPRPGRTSRVDAAIHCCVIDSTAS